MNQNIKALEEICKGVKMGMDSISYLQEKVETAELSDYLKHEYSMYNNILKKVDSAFANYNITPNDYSLGQKAMLWSGIQANTFKDTSNSKISEILIQGTNMGIIEGRKILNSNKNLDSNVKNLINDFVNYQGQSVEKLKKFL